MPSGKVDKALARLGCHADVVSLDPTSLDDVLDGIGRVGRATGTSARAAEVVAGLRDRIDAVRAATDPTSAARASSETSSRSSKARR